ncbi:prostaglandin E synthase 3-like [Oscarella lobularis]|uniref:prostaglandin E synthase 3-like n=1 Tax=Oscarella lobularis TaxID=121494 RepID=UPI0033138E98
MATRAPPEIVWAQRVDVLLVTIRLTDIREHTIDVTDTGIVFVGKGGTGGDVHSFQFDFFKEVNPHESKQKLTSRELFLKLKKKEPGPYWKSLAKEGRLHYVRTDFNKWKDEDDSDDGEEEPELDSLMQQMGNLGSGDPDMGDLPTDSDDSDDEALPDLEEPNTED